jgi:hypothetical protein
MRKTGFKMVGDDYATVRDMFSNSRNVTGELLMQWGLEPLASVPYPRAVELAKKANYPDSKNQIGLDQMG